jgi:hypothetical protein
MKVCGVELKGSDAIICLVSLKDGLYAIHEFRVNRLTISDDTDNQQLRKFQFDFAKLMEDYQVDHVVVRERMTRGKFVGGSVGFKLEAALQLADGIEISLLSPSKIKDIVKNSRVVMNFSDTGLKQFQEPAFNVAFAYLDSL